MLHTQLPQLLFDVSAGCAGFAYGLSLAKSMVTDGSAEYVVVIGVERLSDLTDLEDRAKIAGLLEPERIGVKLSEEFQLHPEQSTDAIVIHHPEAKYFNAR